MDTFVLVYTKPSGEVMYFRAMLREQIEVFLADYAKEMSLTPHFLLYGDVVKNTFREGEKHEI